MTQMVKRAVLLAAFLAPLGPGNTKAQEDVNWHSSGLDVASLASFGLLDGEATMHLSGNPLISWGPRRAAVNR
jgi:hypothetical protein